MTEADWKEIQHFKPHEFGPAPEKMDKTLLVGLDKLRGYISTPMVITSAWREKGEGEHPNGRAADVIFPSIPKAELMNILFSAMRFNEFMGIGIYSDWQLGGIVMGGLHLDSRPSLIRALWSGRRGPDRKNEYFPLDIASLRALSLL